MVDFRRHWASHSAAQVVMANATLGMRISSFLNFCDPWEVGAYDWSSRAAALQPAQAYSKGGRAFFREACFIGGGHMGASASEDFEIVNAVSESMSGSADSRRAGHIRSSKNDLHQSS